MLQKLVCEDLCSDQQDFEMMTVMTPVVVLGRDIWALRGGAKMDKKNL